MKAKHVFLVYFVVLFILSTSYFSALFASSGDTTPPVNGTLSATAGNAQVSLKWSFSDPESGIGNYKLGKVVDKCLEFYEV